MASVHSFWRRLQQVRKPHMQHALAEADGRIQRRKAAKADIQTGHGSTRSKLPILLFEDGDQRGGHSIFSLSRAAL